MLHNKLAVNPLVKLTYQLVKETTPISDNTVTCLDITQDNRKGGGEEDSDAKQSGVSSALPLLFLITLIPWRRNTGKQRRSNHNPSLKFVCRQFNS